MYFHPLPKPVRLLETRPGETGCYNLNARLGTNATHTQQARVTCDGATIPAAATSIVGNATVINPGYPPNGNPSGYITLWPADATQPLVSSGNYTVGSTVNSPFTVGLSPTGQFKIFTTSPTDLTVDIVGYYSPEANDVNGAGLLFTPLAHPVRLLETRINPDWPGCSKPNAPLNGNQEYTQVARGVCDGLTIPVSAQAIVGTATVVFPQGNGYLTLWRTGLTRPTSPDRAASNYTTGQILNRYFTVGLGAGDGAFKMYSLKTTDLIVDVVGFFAPKPAVTLTRTPGSVLAGSTTKLTVTWSATGFTTSADWIGLYVAGAPDGEFIDWRFTETNAANGSLEFEVPDYAGTYEFRYFLSDGFVPIATSYTITVTEPNFALERLDPVNRIGEPGEDLLSGNYNWHLPLINLPGRAGLDLNLGLSYNSLVWTKAGGYIIFDKDYGAPAPGFRLDFPVIEAVTYLRYDTPLPTPFYILILPSGRRVELRNNMAGGSATNIYESVDSSRLRLKVHPVLPGQGFPEMTLHTPEGTKMLFQITNLGYRCNKITDRNGNYITATHSSATGAITTVTDTLGRVINFKYDGYNHLKKIYRCKNNGTCDDDIANNVDYTWAMFEWPDGFNVNANNPNFQTGLNPLGANSYPTFRRVILNDGTYYEFTYTNFGQIRQIEYRSPGSNGTKVLNRLAYNLPNLSPAQADCPRFTRRDEYAYNWMNDSTVSRTYTLNQNPNAVDCEGCILGKVVLPDGPGGSLGTTLTETYAMNGWQRGLLRKSAVQETSSGGEKKKTELTWTQDNIGLTYLRNPRVMEARISDDVGNCRKTTTDYTTTYSQPEYIREYKGCNSIVYRTTKLSYTPTNGTYVQFNPDNMPDLWLIGLVGERSLYEGDLVAIKAKVKYHYDDQGEQLVHQTPVINHESIPNISDPIFNASYRWRGNLTRIQRYDAAEPMNESKSVITALGYNTSGSVIFQRDPFGAQTDLSYTDDFADGTNRNTLAYLTKVTDPDGRLASPQLSYKSKYDYSLGQIKQTDTPNAATVTATYGYDLLKRLTLVRNEITGAETTYEYDVYERERVTWSTIEANQGLFFSAEHMDGHGRVYALEREHPGSAGGLSLQYFTYDGIGRLVEQSNPTEVNAALLPYGEDLNNGFIFTKQTYDWLGRPRITTNQDTSSKILDYTGCGCAGGEITTITDEGMTVYENNQFQAKRRQQKIYHDFLGRAVKTEILNWQNGSPYSATVKTYSVRDQVTAIREFKDGAPLEDDGVICSTGSCRKSVFNYDGHGRLASRRLPMESNDVLYTYDADDKIHTVTDARGTVATYTYDDYQNVSNKRRLLTGIAYTGITPISTVHFLYDPLGERVKMEDDSGYTIYNRDPIGRIQSEQRNFNGLTAIYTLHYSYNLANQLTQLYFQSPIYPNNVADDFFIDYGHDKAGQLTSVSGSSVGSISSYASNMQYFASGALKGMNYGLGGSINAKYNAREQIKEFKAIGFEVPNGQYTQPTFSTAIWGEYSYNSDGSIRYAKDKLNSFFHRAYEYDQTGRLKTGFTGQEANYFVDPENNSSPTGAPVSWGPYKQTYSWSSWGEQTNISERIWHVEANATFSYQNNGRRTGWEYDNAGNILRDGDSNGDGMNDATNVLEYDVAGRNKKVQMLFPTPQGFTWTYNQQYDGDNLVVKKLADNGGPPSAGSYLLRSTVLNGSVVAVLRGDAIGPHVPAGSKAAAYAYAGGRPLAEMYFDYYWNQQQNPQLRTGQQIYWEIEDPITGSRVYNSRYAGNLTGGNAVWTRLQWRVEPTPAGVDAGRTNPFVGGVEDPNIPSYDFNLDPSKPQFYENGFRIGDELAGLMLSSGWAVIDPVHSDMNTINRLGITGHLQKVNDPFRYLDNISHQENPFHSYTDVEDASHYEYVVDGILGDFWQQGSGQRPIDEPDHFPNRARQNTKLGPCATLAKIAGQIADEAIRNNNGVNYGAIVEFDRRLSQVYTGMRWLSTWVTSVGNLAKAGSPKYWCSQGPTKFYFQLARFTSSGPK